jgi:alpha-methylacyl-CoA racemase
MFLAFGVMAALLQSRATGKGQVVDAAMVDGVNSLLALTMTLQAMNQWEDKRQSNLLDGAAPRYSTYKCLDGQYVAIGALEPQFYEKLLQGLGLANDSRMEHPDDKSRWTMQRAIFSEIFMKQPRDYWAELFWGSDACLSPVLSLSEASNHKHNAARSNVIVADGLKQPAVAPRFSSMKSHLPPPMPSHEADAVSSLTAWGWSRNDIELNMRSGVIR